MQHRSETDHRHRSEGRGRRAAVLPVAIGAVIVALVAVLVVLRPGVSQTETSIDPARADTSGASEATEATDEELLDAWPRRRPEVQQGARIEPIPEPVCTDEPTGGDITVLSYNMKSARLAGGLPAIGNVVEASGADIVLLQEVDRFRGSSGDQPALLADRFGMQQVFGANVSYGGSAQYGTAILSAYPITSSVNTLLPNGPGGQQRGLLEAVVDVDGFELHVYNTHIQNEIDYLQQQQTARIASILGPRGDEARILGGDMNNYPGSSEVGSLYSVLDDTWNAVGSGAGLTHPASSPKGRIDYLLYSGQGVSPTSASVVPSTVSDHRPVRATYTVSGTEEVCKRPE